MSELDPGPAPAPPVGPAPVGAVQASPIDLDLIERDLREVESTLARLADGTYVTEVRV